MSGKAADAGRQLWQCPQCSRRYKIPADAPTPKLCPDCKKSRRPDGWYYKMVGQEFGPAPTEQLIKLAEDGTLRPDCSVMYVENGQDAGWAAAQTLPALESYFPQENSGAEPDISYDAFLDAVEEEPFIERRMKPGPTQSVRRRVTPLRKNFWGLRMIASILDFFAVLVLAVSLLVLGH